MTLVLDESTSSNSTTGAISAALPVPLRMHQRIGLRQRALRKIAATFNSIFGPREKQAFGILMYHRIANPPPGKPKPTWNVPPRLLERQLAGLLRRGWQAWPLRQVIECMERDLPIPRKAFVVTFDDGYANNLLHAYPILTRLHVPATVFVATAYLDSKQALPSDDWSVAGQPGVPTDTWRPLTTEECRRLAANGLVELGAHTHTHADFRGRPQAFAADLKQNLEVLRETFGVERPAFAFPYGRRHSGFASPELTSAARDAGVLCSLTTEADLVRPGDSPFEWGRFNVDGYDSARTLAARLGGWYTAVRKLARRGSAGRF